jgi:hypothetical protein
MKKFIPHNKAAFIPQGKRVSPAGWSIMKLVIYRRVSSSPQFTSGLGLEAQGESVRRCLFMNLRRGAGFPACGWTLAKVRGDAADTSFALYAPHQFY